MSGKTPEAQTIIATASYTRHKLRQFWKKSAFSRRKKILMYEAIVTAKLLYALDVTPLTENDRNSLNACFFKGPRQIMGFKTTYGQMFTGEEKTIRTISLWRRSTKS